MSNRPDITEALARRVADYVRRDLPLSIHDGGGVLGEVERRMEALTGCGYALTTVNGTSALHAAYVGLDLPPGSEVIAPVLTFHASISPIMQCRLSPVLVDVDPVTGNICPQAVARALTDRTSCIVVTHMHGIPADMTAICAIAREAGVHVVEDCSLAYGARIGERVVGAIGSVAAFSMQSEKVVSAGEGGCLVTNSRSVYERALLLGNSRHRPTTEVTEESLRQFASTGFGLKHRMHPLAAVLALHDLETLDDRLIRDARTGRLLATALDAVPGVTFGLASDATIGGASRVVVHLGDESRRTRLLEQVAGDDRIWRHTCGRLDQLPTFAAIPPLATTRETWSPRLAGPFDGAEQHNAGAVALALPDPLSDVDVHVNGLVETLRVACP
ncbi:DegT/DnrJ/EryC1/StrS family aminotransferase [Nonomuraea sp. NPDC050547]|uniref:DegT/DnrJ/EryC1/StrS family aminotransferase n=1 Tax=unclassified Nonomuraea TaxID=2593643 RepID=UPI0037B3F319